MGYGTESAGQYGCQMRFTFWSRLVLQIVHAEPAIKHAVLALGALHQYLELPHEDPTRVDHLAFTEEQHRKALTAA
ncbi:hypothetical protein LTS00_006061 [Friedmanniomyces endolithicus]|nr:hypothetical protein LTS00_006061 [Friedmanniomyces endolithicus]